MPNGVARAEEAAARAGGTGVPRAVVAGAGVASSRAAREGGDERVLFPTRMPPSLAPVRRGARSSRDDDVPRPPTAFPASVAVGVAADEDGRSVGLAGVDAGSGDLNRYARAFPPVTVLSATTSEKSRIMALPGACLTTNGSHAHGASDASSFSTLLILRRLGSSSCDRGVDGGGARARQDASRESGTSASRGETGRRRGAGVARFRRQRVF